MQFDHVGVATDDATALAETYETLFGTPVAHEEQFDGLRVVFLDMGGDGYVELLEPMEEGTISHYLEENGPGIHHLAVATDDAERALERAADLGIELVDEEPRPGAWGHSVAFLHPKSTGGVLLEFVEH